MYKYFDSLNEKLTNRNMKQIEMIFDRHSRYSVRHTLSARNARFLRGTQFSHIFTKIERKTLILIYSLLLFILPRRMPA